MKLLYIASCILIVLTHGGRSKKMMPTSNNFKIPYQWYQLQFGFASDRDRQNAESSGNLIPANAIPIDVQPHYYNKSRLRTFVTIPRFQTGIPYTLATISDKLGANGPILQPYPNYEAHNNNDGSNCDRISSAFRVAITECNQMWVIDSGSSDGQCPPQLLLFDLNTDQVIHRYRFDNSLYTAGASLFITPLADVRDPPPTGSCRNTMVYVADVNFHGLVVYNFMQNKAWRIENRFMYPDPNHGLHSVAGESFILMDGIFSLTTDKKNLYFHPLASATEFAVSLEVIDNSTIFVNNPENNYQDFVPLGKRSSACAASAMDSNFNMYCVTLDPIELIVWNARKSYVSKNIKKLPISSADLQFVSGMKVVKNHEGNEELWMMSNRFQKLASGTQDFRELNFRIVVGPLETADPTVPDQDLHNNLVFKD